MSAKQKIVEKIDQNKGFIWGGFLASTIAGFAVSNIFIAVLSVIFITQLIVGKKVKFQKSFYPIIFYFIWGVLSLIWTTNLNNTFGAINKSIYLLLIPLFISQFSYFNLRDLKNVILTLSISLLLYFSISFLNSTYLYLKDSNINHFFYHELTSIFKNNAIYISILTSISVLILIYFPQKKRLDYIILAVLLIYLLLLSSKNLIVSTFLLSIVAMFFEKKSNFNKKNLSIVFSIVACTLLLIIFIENPIKSRFLDESQLNLSEIWYGKDFFDYEFTGTTIRIFQWRVVWEMITDGYIGFLGLGWHNVNYLLYQYFDYYNFYNGYFSINFHNQYLQSLGELGYVGLLIIILVLVISIYFSIVKRIIYLFLFTVLISLSFITESVLSRQKGVIIFIVLYCVLQYLKIKDVGTDKKSE